VRHKTRGVQGSVLEVDGQTVYLEASNGVEMQFSITDLEDDAPKPAKPADPGAANPAKYQALLERMPESVVGLTAVKFARDPKTARSGWAALSAYDKLGWIARTTGLSIDQLAELARTGKGRQIEAHAAVASSNKAARR
jgi:hypothetical protein